MSNPRGPPQPQKQSIMSSNPFQPLANVVQSPMRLARPDLAPASSSNPATPGNERAPSQASSTKSKKKKTSHKKRRGRRKSFAVLPEESHDEAIEPERTPHRPDLYLQTSGNFSNTSIDSQALLDHRYVSSPAQSRHTCSMQLS